MEAQMSGIMVEVANEGNSHERPECDRERGTTEARFNPQSREALEMELEMMRARVTEGSLQRNQLREPYSTQTGSTHECRDWVSKKPS